MTLVAGIDSSTQSCKVVIRDAETGALVREGRAKHPDGTTVDPHAWWDALASSSSDAFATGSAVRSSTTVWKSSSASRRPWEISGW